MAHKHIHKEDADQRNKLAGKDPISSFGTVLIMIFLLDMMSLAAEEPPPYRGRQHQGSESTSHIADKLEENKHLGRPLCFLKRAEVPVNLLTRFRIII